MARSVKGRHPTVKRKEKHIDPNAGYFLEPIAVETLGVFNASARVLLDDLGRRITSSSGETRETSFLLSEGLGVGTALQCCPLTAQIDDHTPICIGLSIFLIFLSPSGA